MRIIRCILIYITFSLFGKYSYSQLADYNNFLKITEAYIDFQCKPVALDSNSYILFAGANSLGVNSISFHIYFDKVDFIGSTKYSHIYKLKNYRVILFEDLDKSYILKDILKEGQYENLNRPDININRELYNTWTIKLDNKYAVTSVNLGVSNKREIEVLQKHKVTFSRHFKAESHE